MDFICAGFYQCWVFPVLDFTCDGVSVFSQVCPSPLVSLRAMVAVARVASQPPCPLRRRRKPRGPMRSMATTPTSVRRSPWIAPSRIIAQPSKCQVLQQGMFVSPQGQECFGALGSSLTVHRALLSDGELGWLGWNELMESQNH